MATAKSRSGASKAAAPHKPPVSAKSPAKSPAKPPVKTPAKTEMTPSAPAAVRAVKAAKPAKPKKDKLVRDSFTIPKSEYLVIDALKQRAAKLGIPAKKSELMRAGIKALAAMAEAAFATALKNVPAIKTGRPRKA